MTDQPTGRALAEAAARAMGWTLTDAGCSKDGLHRDEPACWVDADECLAWLREKRWPTWFAQFFADGAWHCKADAWPPYPQTVTAASSERCPTLRDALMRLVVAVAEREAIAKRYEGAKWVENTGEATNG